ncbi:MAG: hypothetical protein RBS22_05620, partial [Spongiibacteraceae bacterium]|nr:hypothetical protein [Spongiibacteraceae bacterium]
FGAIQYQGEGTFIAGGAGVTPFIAILRDLRAKHAIGDNRVIFANKTRKDIILHEELREMLGDQLVNILSKEKTADYPCGQVSAEFINQHCGSLDKYFYVCAPPPMMEAVQKHLAALNVAEDRIVMEAF